MEGMGRDSQMPGVSKWGSGSCRVRAGKGDWEPRCLHSLPPPLTPH